MKETEDKIGNQEPKDKHKTEEDIDIEYVKGLLEDRYQAY